MSATPSDEHMLTHKVKEYASIGANYADVLRVLKLHDAPEYRAAHEMGRAELRITTQNKIYRMAIQSGDRHMLALLASLSGVLDKEEPINITNQAELIERAKAALQRLESKPR